MVSWYWVNVAPGVKHASMGPYPFRYGKLIYPVESPGSTVDASMGPYPFRYGKWIVTSVHEGAVVSLQWGHTRLGMVRIFHNY